MIGDKGLSAKKYRPQQIRITLDTDSIGIQLLLGAVANARLFSQESFGKYGVSNSPPDTHWEADEYLTERDQQRLGSLFRQLEEWSKIAYEKRRSLP